MRSKFHKYLFYTAITLIPNFFCLAQKMERPTQHLDDTTFSTDKETVTLTHELMRPKIRELEVGPSPLKASESNIAYAMCAKEEKTLVL